MKPAIIVHGGAWDWPDEQDDPKAGALRDAAKIGWDILQAGGSALDAVERAVNYLEDFPLFDAGTGSHLNAIGEAEMDALIIDGSKHDYGAVAAVRRVRYPISLARRVLDESKHCLLVGAGADDFAARMGMPLIPNLTLVTDAELQAFMRQQPAHGPQEVHDTVGAIALDVQGHIAVGTSTGGTPAKAAGRVGDAPLYGAGGYADSLYGGAAASGKGENSMRVLLSKYAVDQIAAGHNAQSAAVAAMQYIEGYFSDSMVALITLDANGRLGVAHTTPKFSVGWVDANGVPQASMKNGLA